MKNVLALFVVLFAFEAVAQQSEAWHKYQHAPDSTQIESCNLFRTMITDPSGDIIQLENYNSSYGWLLSKYHANGSVIWKQTFFNDTAHGKYQYGNILADALGNIIICGSRAIDVSQIDYDILLTKADSSGNILWQKQYDNLVGETTNIDNAAVDISGNIYVCGSTKITGTHYEALLMKIAPQGNLLWYDTICGTASLDDNLYAVKLDSAGGICVAGMLNNSGTGKDPFVARYDAAGNRQWLVLPSDVGSGDFKNLDVKGNRICAVGSKGLTGQTDFFGYAMDLNGNYKWQYTYASTSSEDEAFLVSYDNYNDVYLGGEFVIQSPYSRTRHVVKINDSGTPIWSLLNVPVSSTGQETVAQIVPDGSHQLYLCGVSDNNSNQYTIVKKYNSSGGVAWTKSHSSLGTPIVPCKTIVGSGTNIVYAGPGSTLVDSLICYNPSGIAQWNQLSEPDAPRPLIPIMAYAPTSGHFYVATTRDRGIIVSKFNLNGAELWTAFYEAPLPDTIGAPRKIVVDGNGDVLVAFDKSSQNKLKVLKFNSNGTFLWARSFDAGGTTTGHTYGLAVDNQNNVVITGGLRPVGSAVDIYIVKYDPNGNMLWQRSFSCTGNTNDGDEGKDVRIDPADNVYVAADGSRNVDHDFTILKYSSQGTLIWSRLISNMGAASGLELSLTGDTIFAGGLDYQVNPIGIFTCALDSSGNVIWQDTLFAPSGNFVGIKRTDSLLYITAQATPVSSSSDEIFTAAYDFSGTLRWTQQYNGVGNMNDRPYFITTDANSNAIVGGSSYEMTITQDFIVLKYNPQGQALDTIRYALPKDQILRSGFVDPYGGIYVAGSCDIGHYHLIKFCSGNTPVVVSPNAIICSGTSVTLNASSATSYSWSPAGSLSNVNIANPVASPQTTTTYTLVTTDALGCTSSKEVMVTVLQRPFVTSSTDSVISCTGQPVQLSVSGAFTYNWSPTTGITPATGNTVTTTTSLSQLYTIVGDNGYGCSDTTQINFLPISPLPSVTFQIPLDSMCLYNPPIAVSGGSPSGGIYSGQGVVAGMFDPQLAGPGMHTLFYTYTDSSTGCDSTASQFILVSNCTGIREAKGEHNLVLAPNPSEETSWIKVSGINEPVTVQIFDAYGKMIRCIIQTPYAGECYMEVPVKEWADGIYWVRLTSGNYQSVKVLIKQSR